MLFQFVSRVRVSQANHDAFRSCLRVSSDGFNSTVFVQHDLKIGQNTDRKVINEKVKKSNNVIENAKFYANKK
jgi:hypothetical protein